MESTYKLTYFDTPGLGEPLRYLLAMSGFKYEHIRVAPDTKPDTEFGKLPILEVDGKVLHRTLAIGRYLAKKTGLAGKTEWDAAEADAVIDTLADMRLLYYPYFLEKDEAKKAVRLDELKNTHNPFFLSRFEKIVKENGGHFVQNQLTWADILFTCTVNIIIFVSKDVAVLEKYPNLKALQQKVVTLPGLKEYLAAQAAKN